MEKLKKYSFCGTEETVIFKSADTHGAGPLLPLHPVGCPCHALSRGLFIPMAARDTGRVKPGSTPGIEDDSLRVNRRRCRPFSMAAMRPVSKQLSRVTCLALSQRFRLRVKPELPPFLSTKPMNNSESCYI